MSPVSSRWTVVKTFLADVMDVSCQTLDDGDLDSPLAASALSLPSPTHVLNRACRPVLISDCSSVKVRVSAIVSLAHVSPLVTSDEDRSTANLLICRVLEDALQDVRAVEERSGDNEQLGAAALMLQRLPPSILSEKARGIIVQLFECCLETYLAGLPAETRRMLAILGAAAQTLHVESILQAVTITLERDGVSVEKRLDVLFSLSEALFSPEAQGKSFSLDDAYFRLLQEGLCCRGEGLARKKALFLLKRSLDEVLNGRLKSTPLTSASSGEWDDFLIVLESIREEQVHIVRQVAPRLKSLSSSTGSFHVSWILLLYKLLLNHQNTAVTKWGLVHVLSTFYDDFKFSSCHPEALEFFTGPLLQALNCTRFYYEKGRGVEIHLPDFFHKSSCVLPTDEERKRFWNALLTGITEISWGPIPLFFVTESLYQALPKRRDLLLHDTAEKLRIFAAVSIGCQEPLLKQAIRCFLFKILLETFQPVTSTKAGLIYGFKILETFYGDAFWYGTRLWEQAVRWMGSHEMDLAEWKVLLSECEARSFALALAISIPRTRIDQAEIVTSLQSDICESLGRPYYNERVHPLKIVQVLAYLANIYKSPPRREGRVHLTYKSRNEGDTEELCFLGGAGFVDAVLKVLEEASLEDKGEMVECSLEVLRRIPAANHIPVRPLTGLLEDCCSRLKSAQDMESDGGPVIKAVFVIKECLKDCELVQRHLRKNISASDLLAGHFDPDVFTSNSGAPDKNRELNSKVNSLQWEILASVMEISDNATFEDLDYNSLFSLASTAIASDKGGSFPFILKCTQLAISKRKHGQHWDKAHELLYDLLRLASSALLELRKNDLFWPALTAYVKLCLKVLLTSDGIEEKAKEAAAEGFSSVLDKAEVVTGAGALVTSALSEEEGTFNNLLRRSALVMPSICRLLTFGPLFRKDARLLMSVNEALLGLEELDLSEGSDHMADALARAQMLNVLCRIERDQVWLRSLVLALLSHADDVNGGKKRQFKNSLGHLTQLRVCQTLLVISPLLDEDNVSMLFEKALAAIATETLQTGTRHYYEWILIMLLKRDFSLVDRLEKSFEEVSRSRLAVVPSFLIVRTFAAIYAEHVNNAVILDETMQKVAPWCMAQHFATRRCAQCCLTKMYSKAVKMASDVFEAKYSFLLKCVDQCILQGDSDKNWKLKNEDLFLTHFDPVRCFSLRDVFYELPRLCGVADQEWKNFSIFADLEWPRELIVVESIESPLPPLPTPTELNDAVVDDPNLSEVVDIQKKIIPWQEMYREELRQENEEMLRERAFPDLTVCASLIDKAPNLGGLCRTCEILGVGEYVLPSVKFLRDKEFQSVSVTAHNWLMVLESPPGEVASFLEEKRELGYSIVAVEQTTASVSLEKFKFPRKTVLLLGHEKKGVSVELLKRVDYCVQIPQTGIIRSFNVHVTGALVIWEYVRQWRENEGDVGR